MSPADPRGLSVSEVGGDLHSTVAVGIEGTAVAAVASSPAAAGAVPGQQALAVFPPAALVPVITAVEPVVRGPAGQEVPASPAPPAPVTSVVEVPQVQEHGVVVEVPQVELHKLTNLVPKVTVVEEPTLVDVPYVQTVTEARPNLVRQDLQRHVPRLTVREELQVVPKPVTRVVEETVQVPVASPPRPIVHIKAKVDVVEDVQQVKVPTQVISSEEVVEVPYDLYVVREEVHLKPQIERIVKDVVIPYAQEEIVEVPEERVSTRVVEVPQFTTIVNRRHIPSFVNGTGKPSPAVTREAMAAQEAHEERLWVEVNELRVKNEQLAEHCSQQKLELEQCHARVNAMVDDLSEEKRKQFELSVKLKAASGHSYAGIVTTVVKQAYSPTAPAACGDSCAPTPALLDQVPHRGAAAAADPVPHDACRADASA